MPIPYKLKSITLLAVKIAASILLIRWVFQKIDFPLVIHQLQQAHTGWFLFAVLLFIISRLASAMRLNIYFRDIAVHIPGRTNQQLYWLGMFYNLFLPGGIGGDAYKVIWLKKNYSGVTTLSATQAVLLDRVSGMVAAILLLLVVCPFIALLPATVKWVALPAAFTGYALYTITVRKWLTRFYKSITITSIWSAGIQLIQCLSVVCLMIALGIYHPLPEYMLLFLASSLVSVLPVTLGGIGAREIVFLYGSVWLGLPQHISVTISLMFYLINAVVSLAGIWYFLNGRFLLKTPTQQ